MLPHSHWHFHTATTFPPSFEIYAPLRSRTVSLPILLPFMSISCPMAFRSPDRRPTPFLFGHSGCLLCTGSPIVQSPLCAMGIPNNERDLFHRTRCTLRRFFFLDQLSASVHDLPKAVLDVVVKAELLAKCLCVVPKLLPVDV